MVAGAAVVFVGMMSYIGKIHEVMQDVRSGQACAQEGGGPQPSASFARNRLLD